MSEKTRVLDEVWIGCRDCEWESSRWRLEFMAVLAAKIHEWRFKGHRTGRFNKSYEIIEDPYAGYDE